MEYDQKRNAIKSSLKRQLCFSRQLKTYSLHNLYELNILAFRITMACLKQMHCLAFGIFTSSAVLICLVWVCCCFLYSNQNFGSTVFLWLFRSVITTNREFLLQIIQRLNRMELRSAQSVPTQTHTHTPWCKFSNENYSDYSYLHENIAKRFGCIQIDQTIYYFPWLAFQYDLLFYSFFFFLISCCRIKCRSVSARSNGSHPQLIKMELIVVWIRGQRSWKCD